MIPPEQYQAMLKSPRCGAKTRAGTPCAAPAVAGKKRCRMHGGAPGSGAPKGNANALKHGKYTNEAREARRDHRCRMRTLRELLREYQKTMRKAHDKKPFVSV